MKKINEIVVLIIILLHLLIISLIFCTVQKANGEPYLICDPPAITDNITKYYIQCSKNDPNMYNIDPNDRYSVLIPIDPNKTILVEDGFPDPNFYSIAKEDGSLYLDLEDIKTNISYSLLIQPCSDLACGCPSFLSFVPINTPHKIKGLRITKEDCCVNKYYFINIE